MYGDAQSTLKEVPVISSLKDIIDNDECPPTPHFNQCNIVQIQIDSNKTLKFYSHYENSKPLRSKRVNKQKKCSTEFDQRTFHEVTKLTNLKLQEKECPKDNIKDVEEAVKCGRFSFKSQGHIAQSASLANTLNLSAYLLKASTRIFRSMPNVAFDFSHSSKFSSNTPVASDDLKGIDQHSRRISFRKKLHNLKKYIDDSITENFCTEPLDRDDTKSEESLTKKGKKQKRNVQEMSKELWQLRAMLADADEMESDDSASSTLHNEDETIIHANSSPSCVKQKSEVRRKTQMLETGTPNVSEIKTDTPKFRSQEVGGMLNLDEDTQPDIGIQKKPSVRRQIYRNAIARQQQKIFEQEREMKCEDLSKFEFNPKSCLTSDEVVEQHSFESSKEENSRSSTDVHNSRLERLRGDSGYKSLENQQSLRTSFQVIIQESNVTSEDETTFRPRVLAPLSSSQILTRRVHSADDTLVAIPLSLFSVTDETTKCIVNKSHKVTLSDNLVKERRDRHKNDHKSSQRTNIFSHSKCRNNLASSSEVVTAVKPHLCNTSLLSTTSSFASSLFSRFLKSHARRTCTRTQRDYSIDERSDAIFNEFLRFDPTLEMRHTHCFTRTSPRSHFRRHKFSDKYSPLSLISKSSDRVKKEENVTKQRHLTRKNKSTISEKNVECVVLNSDHERDGEPLPKPSNLKLESDKSLEDDPNNKTDQSSLKRIPTIQLTEEE